MFTSWITRARVTVLTTAALSASLSAAVGIALPSPANAESAPASDLTSVVEARRVDRVPAPKLGWFSCSTFAAGADCATVKLPLDYDQPNGAKTAISVLRIKATEPARKIGTLFLNPGGPGGTGTAMAAVAPLFFGPEIRARFDIVGFDPRGTNFSENVKCWQNMGQQSSALAGFTVLFPWTPEETASYVRSAKAFGKACSTTGKPLSGSMSSTEMARDMDVLRRAVGDRQLTYLGFSYGSYPGQVYANLFPDRVRALAIDGVIDPVAWAGTPETRSVPQTVRLRSGEGAAKALHEVLVRCGKAGPSACGFASAGDPVKNYDSIRTALKKAPLVFSDPGTRQAVTVTYPFTVGLLLSLLYTPTGAAVVPEVLSSIYTLQHPTAPTGTTSPTRTTTPTGIPAPTRTTTPTRTTPTGIPAPTGSPGPTNRTAARQTAARQTAARATLGRVMSAQQVKAASLTPPLGAPTPQGLGLVNPWGFPYTNTTEAFQSVLCTDGLNPADASRWPAYADAADTSAPDFGRAWAWASAPCASQTWTVTDEDAYRGPFTRRTANPVLIVGNSWDPATNYDSAVTVASLLPNSRLLSSASWGHTAFGTSACVTTAVESYLLTKALPAKGTHCVGDTQPFAPTTGSGTSSPPSRQLPPVVPILPGTPRR